MSAEIAVIHQAQAAQQFSNEDVQLIKETVCKGATDTEFKLFMNQCRTTGLNPLARQVFAVKRWDSSLRREVMAIQVSIDGFRLIAERTGKYAGQTKPEWCGEDGMWKDVWLGKMPPAAARVGVLRSDFKEPCYGVARFDSYAQRKKEGDLTSMWQKMGDVMICKCAESLALRKAFPQELSGLYTSDEMAQATPDQPETLAPQLEPPKYANKTAELTDFAKAYAAEISLADTDEKLAALITRNAVQLNELSAVLPKWHEKLLAIITVQRISNEKNAATSNPIAAGMP